MGEPVPSVMAFRGRSAGNSCMSNVPERGGYDAHGTPLAFTLPVNEVLDSGNPGWNLLHERVGAE